jgi:hypothetical protein
MTLSLKVSPAQARVLIDGVRVTSPFRGRFRKDAALHHIEVTADGFRPAKEFVAFDGDKGLEIALQHAPLIRRESGLEKLIERAEQTSKTSAEPALPATRQAAPRTEEPLLERPNPYTAD